MGHGSYTIYRFLAFLCIEILFFIIVCLLYIKFFKIMKERQIKVLAIRAPGDGDTLPSLEEVIPHPVGSLMTISLTILTCVTARQSLCSSVIHYYAHQYSILDLLASYNMIIHRKTLTFK